MLGIWVMDRVTNLEMCGKLVNTFYEIQCREIGEIAQKIMRQSLCSGNYGFFCRGTLASCFQFQFLVSIPHIKAPKVTGSRKKIKKLLQICKARPSPCMIGEPS